MAADPKSTPATTRRSHSDVVELIGTEIVSGKYAVGQILPREEEFVETLDVSRGVVREALRVLASKGLVEARPKRGTQVLPMSNWQLLDREVLSWRIGHKVDVNLLRDLNDFRAMIEPAASALAAERATSAELQLISALAREMEYLQDDEFEFIEADMRFHRAILHAAHNDLLIQVGAAVESSLRLSREVTVSIGHGRRVAEHVKVADAVASRNVTRARRAMGDLINLVFDDIATILESDLIPSENKSK